MITLVAPPIQQAGCFRIGARYDDSGDLHDVQLEAGRIQSLDLLVLRNQDLAALMAAFLAARLLVFDVVTGHAHFDEPANQVSHMGVTPMPGIRIGDDEGPVVDLSARLFAPRRSSSSGQTVGSCQP